MPFWKLLLLNAYYHASLPIRLAMHKVWSAMDRVPISILYYHCMTDRPRAPWMMSNGQFVEQITWLQRHFDLISLAEAQRRIRSGKNHRPAVAITFDDGYSENCEQAIPLLIERNIPCTYFVTLENIVQGLPFEHDLKNGWDFAPNTIEQVRAMAAAGIEIGAHTCTHCDLGRVTDTSILGTELLYARKELENLLDTRIRFFSFPFGQRENLTNAAFSYAARAGYDAVCSAYGALNFPGDDAFHLQRVPATEEFICVKNWVTADPRKIWIPRFAYSIVEDNGCSSPVAGSAVAVSAMAATLPMQLTHAEH
jgi:peptidoglycan/xylan/chitin deacetylase (PgdA/CDA1 family)